MKKIEATSIIAHTIARRGTIWAICSFLKFDYKLKAGEILFKNEGSLNVHECAFPNHHNGKGKALMMMASVVEKDEEMILRPTLEPDLDQMA